MEPFDSCSLGSWTESPLVSRGGRIRSPLSQIRRADVLFRRSVRRDWVLWGGQVRFDEGLNLLE